MTPLPKPQPTPRRPGSRTGTRRMRADNPIPMTSSQYLRWLNKKKPQAATPRQPLTWFNTIAATTQQGEAGDETDAGYLGAIRQSPRQVGLDDGQVPLAVALRLLALGLVERVVPANDNGEVK